MSTTIVTSQRRQPTTTSTPTTLSTSTRRRPATSSTRPKTTVTSAPLRIASSPTTASPSNLASDFTFIQLESNAATATPTSLLTQPSVVDIIPGASATCSTNSDCAKDRICSNAKCVTTNDAAPFGGSGSNQTSHLTTGSAIGIGVGLVAVLTLMVGLGFWFWQYRGRRPRNDSIEAPVHIRKRSSSTATDQKTLVASMPSSPQNVAFSQQNIMGPGLFARAVALQEIKDVDDTRQVSMDNSRGRRSMGKALPLPPPNPLAEHPLPRPPTQPTRYTVNVNINKSMIFDDDMRHAVSSLRGNDTPRNVETPRERTPRYKFEEYVPPIANAPPPIFVAQPPPSNKRDSEYELSQLPNKRASNDTASLPDDSSVGGSEPSSPIVETISKLESKAPQLPLPDLPPPSPSFSFRSYDWYQDIIGDPQHGEHSPTLPNPKPARTPTQASLLKPLSLSSEKKPTSVDYSLYPQPLSPVAPPAASGLHLHPSSAAAMPSPTSPNFRLSPTVYTPPSRQPPVQPPLPSRRSVRTSELSTMTRNTHDSRSWLPEDGLYLAEEGEFTAYETYRRPSEESRPTSYSPLT
ncbi:hypothetical protein TW65_06587 [Stemphylium lycopersici]|nr:hypothetical protein TW65_06587 [Stemphylium lycopersici]